MHILSLSVSSSECGVLFCKVIAVLNIILPFRSPRIEQLATINLVSVPDFLPKGEGLGKGGLFLRLDMMYMVNINFNGGHMHAGKQQLVHNNQ